MIALDLTHSLLPGNRWADIKMSPSMTVAEVMAKICRHTGSSIPSSGECGDTGLIEFILRDPSGKVVGNLEKLPSQSATLESLGIGETGWSVHVVDRCPNSLLRELQQAEAAGEGRYVMSEEAYAARKGTAREFLQKLRREKPELFEKAAAVQRSQTEESNWGEDEVNELQKMMVGQRAQIKGTSIRGEVCFLGPLSESDTNPINVKAKPGQGRLGARGPVWAGVRLDFAQGIFDGTLKTGQNLFDCGGARRGLLVDPNDLEVGPQFGPIADLDDLDEI